MICSKQARVSHGTGSMRFYAFLCVSMRCVLFSAIEGPLLQRWYALPPAPRILVVCQTRTVDGGPPPEAAYAYVRQYVRIYERTAEHRRNRTQQAPHDEHGLRSIGDTVPNKHPTRDFLRPDYYSSVL